MGTARLTTHLTMLDWAKRIRPDGQVDEILELLAESNPVLEDAVVLEGNLPTGHRTTVRTGLPTIAWRLLNYGVAPSKSTTAQVDDQCGMLEGYSEVDKEVANLGGNPGAFRASEDNAFLEVFSQTLADTIFKGDTTLYPEKFLGLEKRYSSLSAGNGGNIVSAGGTGSDNTSMWLITWGPQTCHMIFPKGSRAGFASEDLGEVTLQDAGGGLYQGYRTHFQWKMGMTLRDWRYVVRVANIDVSDLTDDASAGADLIRKGIAAYWKRPTKGIGAGSPAIWYCNKTIGEYLQVQAINKVNVQLTLSEVEGRPVTKLCGAPIRICDCLTNSEAAVT